MTWYLETEFHGFDLFMKHKLKSSKNLINYEVSLFFLFGVLLKNTKSEVEISPDNEVLDLLSKETPPAPKACQGETNESLTSLDRVCRKALPLNCCFSSPAMNVNSFMEHAITVHFGGFFLYQSSLVAAPACFKIRQTLTPVFEHLISWNIWMPFLTERE